MSQRKQKENCVFSEGNPLLRDIIETFRGVFSFSENQQLYCNFCRVEIEISDDKIINDEVNLHISGEEHEHNVKAFKDKDNRKKHVSLLDALSDGTLVSISDGLARCVCCKVVLNDSLTNLKNHLVSLDHLFKVHGFKDGEGNLKRKSARMIYLVAQTAELDFHKEGNVTKVLCERCKYIVEPTYQSVKYHLDSKKHNHSHPTKDTQDNIVKRNFQSGSNCEPKYKSRKPRTPRTPKRLKTVEDTQQTIEDVQVQSDVITLSEDSYYVVGEFEFSDQHSFEQIIVTTPAEAEDDPEKDN